MSPEAKKSCKENEVKLRKPYRKPHLEELGDLRSMTLGGSPGINDSGSEEVRRPQGSAPQKRKRPGT
jgi:hypothetical protein